MSCPVCFILLSFFAVHLQLKDRKFFQMTANFSSFCVWRCHSSFFSLLVSLFCTILQPVCVCHPWIGCLCTHTRGHIASKKWVSVVFCSLLFAFLLPSFDLARIFSSWYSVNCAVSEWGVGESRQQQHRQLTVYRALPELFKLFFQAEKNWVCFCDSVYLILKLCLPMPPLNQSSLCAFVCAINANRGWEKTICFDLICQFTLSICFHQFGIQMHLLLLLLMLLVLSFVMALQKHLPLLTFSGIEYSV